MQVKNRRRQYPSIARVGLANDNRAPSFAASTADNRTDTGHEVTDFLRRLSETMHSTSSSLQFVHGAPCSVTLQRTLRDLQHWHAFEALRLTGLPVACPSTPAAEALRFCWFCCCCCGRSAGSEEEAEQSDMVTRVRDVRGWAHDTKTSKPTDSIRPQGPLGGNAGRLCIQPCGEAHQTLACVNGH